MISDSGFTILAIVAAFIVAAVLVRAARGVVHRALDAMEVSADSRRALHIRATRLIDALRLLAFAVAALASVSLALARFGVTEPRWDPRVIVEWLLTHGVNLVVIVIGAAIVLRTGNLLIDSVQHREDTGQRQHIARQYLPGFRYREALQMSA